MDQISKLISLVKNYEFLYKNDSCIYKGKLKTKDTWNKIGAQLNISGDKCKMKWKNLVYKRAKLRQTQNPEGCTKKVCRYEKQLTFLDEVESWKTPNEHDYSRPSSSISSQSIKDSDKKISSNTEIKDGLIMSNPVTNEIILSETMINIGSSSAAQNNIEIKDDISPSNPEPHNNSITTLLRRKQKMDNYSTIKNESGAFHLYSLQRQQIEDNCLQSNALENINAGTPNLPQKQQNGDNCYEQATLGNVTQNVAKDTLPQKQQNMDECFQSDTLTNTVQNGFQQTQKKNKVDSYVQSTTISNIINPIFDESDNSSKEYQLKPISCSTSSRPRTIFEDLHEKIENFLESATSTVNELQKESKNSTSVLFESLAKRITTSNLTKKQINDIEGGTCMLVYTDLEKFYLANNPPKI